MLLYAIIDSEDISSAPYFSGCTKAAFLSWLLNVLTRNLRILRDGCLLIDWNPKGWEVTEHISTKVDMKSQMLSTFQNGE